MSIKQIKQILCIIVSTTCIAGCSSEGESISVSDESSVSIETETPQAEEQVSDVVVVERNIDVDSVHSFLLNGEDLGAGYIAVNVSEEDPDVFDSGYRTDVLIAEKDGRYGFYDYDGNMLLEPKLVRILQAPGLFQAYEELGNPLAVEKDFMSYGGEAGIGGVYPEYTISDSKVYQFGEAVETSDGDPSDLYLLRSDDGVGIVNGRYEVLSEMHGWHACGRNTLSDGYVFLSNTEAGFDYETGTYTHGELMLFNEGGEEILNETVEEAGYMRNGYAPVKKNGKWGYINEAGEYVIDCIFDDASSLNDEKAYVKYNGEWIILNIAESLNNGAVNTEAIDTALQKFDEERNSSSIGMVTVNVDGLNIRKEADSTSDKLGKVIQGNTYYVYETVHDTDYTWYKIGEDQWIADDGTWCTYQMKE